MDYRTPPHPFQYLLDFPFAPLGYLPNGAGDGPQTQGQVEDEGRLYREFCMSVDIYLESCLEDGVEPVKPMIVNP